MRQSNDFWCSGAPGSIDSDRFLLTRFKQRLLQLLIRQLGADFYFHNFAFAVFQLEVVYQNALWIQSIQLRLNLRLRVANMYRGQNRADSPHRECRNAPMGSVRCNYSYNVTSGNPLFTQTGCQMQCTSIDLFVCMGNRFLIPHAADPGWLLPVLGKGRADIAPDVVVHIVANKVVFTESNIII